MLNNVVRFAKSEEGSTAIEYGLIAGLISVVIITAAGLIGEDLKEVFETISAALPAKGR